MSISIHVICFLTRHVIICLNDIVGQVGFIKPDPSYVKWLYQTSAAVGTACCWSFYVFQNTWPKRFWFLGSRTQTLFCVQFTGSAAENILGAHVLQVPPKSNPNPVKPDELIMKREPRWKKSGCRRHTFQIHRQSVPNCIHNMALSCWVRDLRDSLVWKECREDTISCELIMSSLDVVATIGRNNKGYENLHNCQSVRLSIYPSVTPRDTLHLWPIQK